ncbi:Maternal protein tudor [Lucilia cuprina]|uniref:Maternal protein tudor n=1 Tax=Lucilia cuprina TaxID=7375 RepID=A0A0L0BPT0_LUCCU|nr:Maternal protein tudor [Lucilia cuprina]
MNTSQGSTATSSGTTTTTTTSQQSLTNGGSSASTSAGGNNERKRLFITHVDSLGPYLKISGHLNPDAMGVVRSQVQKILTTCYTIDSSWPVARQLALLLPGAMCLYKRINGAAPADFEFVRSRIIKVIAAPSSAPPTTTPKVEIEIIDYGQVATVASVELLFPQNPEQLVNIPTMCSQYIVLGICEDWKKSQLDEILRMIAHHSVEISIVKEFNQFKFITMKWKEFNIAEFLIHQKKMGAPIANDLLFEKFSKILKQQQQQQQAVLNNNNMPTPNMNNNQNKINNNNNNNNYYNKNHNAPTQSSSSSTSSGINTNSNNNVVAVAQAAAKAVSAVSINAPPHQTITATTTGATNNQLREQMAARRSLSARLQQLQHPQLHQQLHMRPNVGHMASAGQSGGHHMIITAPVQPRMPQSIGNLRSMMQGIHLQNNRIPYTGLHYQPQHHPHHQQPPPPIPTAVGMSATAGSYNGLPGVLPSTVPHFNNFNPRYQRPPPPTQLSAINMPQPQMPLSPPRRTTPATFKSNTLTVGQVYDVSVSFVENGPFLFSVQLVSHQDDLTDMMNQIEKVHLKQFSEKPLLGTACIARYSEDGQLYRALITGVQPTACKVAYIDYGNAELVHFRDLYEIPDEFLKFKAFALRFTLSGHKELEPIDDSLKKAFKDLVIYKNCKLKVMPLEGPPLVQYCELYLQEKNILHVLKQIQKTRLVYAKNEPLRNNDIVEIRYIDSPKNFYVQKVDNIPAFEKLMDDMFLYYNKNQNVPNHLALGAPCIVKYDNEWYRAEVMRADSTAIIVRHVDFGYEQKVTKNLLSTIAEKHLKLPRQAVQCCLKGFENNELSKDLATTQFEMLAEESNRQRRSFTVKVFRIQPDGVNLVNLCTKDLNVMKKLYKLSMPFEQYLTLEKEDFNLHAGGHHGQNGHHKTHSENGNKTPSIASSTDVASMHSSKKGHILNSTTLQSEEQRLQQKQQQLQQQQQQTQQRQYNRNNNVNNQSYATSVTTTEWDKQSSNSSLTTENRDSRSSSSEFKQQQGQRRQNYYKNYPSNRQQQQQHQQYITSSNNSVASDKRSTTSSYNNQRPSSLSNSNTPPRFQKQQQQNKQNYQQQQQNSPRQHRQQQQQQQQQQQRPQNAPQGFSQQPKHKDNQLNNSNKSSSSGNTETSKKSQEQCNKNNMDNASATSTQQQQQQQAKDKTTTYTFVPLNKAFPVKAIETPCREEVIISWWISPHQFYTQLKSRSAEFERFMKDIQQFYHKLPLQQLQLKVGSYVMARQRKDNIIYRARIMACNQMLRKYKVHFVDFGNQYTVTSEDIWQVEKRFADFPIMAYLCGFDGIVSNYDHLYIIDRMDKYLPQGVTLQCEYIEKNNHDLYYVNVKVNKISLKQTLCTEGLITEICPELRLDLLAGQQIRAKISSINNMLNFKIQLPFYGCKNMTNIEMLCSYDDVRFVKSNQDIARKFKQFYDGKSCVLNIKDVNDNKVLLLRPLMPLLKEDIPWYICTPPILLESFNVRIVYVPSPYRLYGQIVATEMEMAQLLDDMFNYYENEGTLLETFDLEQICAAKGSDGNWYRARIQSNQNAQGAFEVYYIDYGNTEPVEKQLLKKLEEKFYLNKSAYAVEINLPLKTLAADMQQKQKGKKAAGSTASNETDIAVIKSLTSLTLDKEITVKCLEVKNNHLIADLLMPDGKNMIDLLKEQKLIKSRDLEFMRKLLEKEKPNVLEYIECVDLTLEDEDEGGDEKAKTGNRSKPSTPKKKKTNNKEVETEKKTAAASQEEKKLIKPEETQEKPKTAEVKAAEIVPEKPKETAKVEETKAKIQEVVVEPMPEPVAEPEPEPVVNPYADMEHAILAHCDNPAQFFIHPMDKVKDLQRLQENIQIVASSLPPLMRIINGAYCISMYSVDKQWYRAKILDAELMVLQFIDFGNTDCVNDTTDLKEMIVFPDVEPLCIPCALPIRPNGTIDWQDAANAIFNDSYNKVLDYEFITQGEQFKKSYVNLYIEGVNVMEKLIKDGYAKPLEIVDSGENCFISHVNGISDFYIQYEKDSKGLELIEIYLADYEKLKKLEKFEKHKIVAALFPDDEMWYRAKLLKQVGEVGYEVLFIDYGNTSISPECREISQEIAELPPLSKKCALEVPASCTGWSDAAEQKFMEIADTGETIFSVELREPSQHHAVVHLLIDGHNINDDLEELCEKKPLPEPCNEMNTSFNNSTLHTSVYETGTLYEAVISHVNSPCDFYIQFTKDTIRLEDMTQSLNTLAMEKLENPCKLQLCAALYPEDSKLYRAKILEILDNNEYRVLFVDFGNEAVTTELKTLPQDLVELKEFSKKCQLENALKYSQFGPIATESFNTLIDQCEGLVKIDIINEGTDKQPAIVKAFAMNTEENLCESLNKLLGMDHKTQTVTIAPQVNSGILPEEDLEKAAKTCVISHAISPSQFYIQLKSNSAKMEMVKKALLNLPAVNENQEKLQQTEVGRVCCAYSAEDDCYYRGRIEGVLAGEKGYEIFLLDYGNTIITQQIHELPEELRSIPAIALKCRLNSIPNGVSDSILEERFAALLETHFGEIYEIEQDDVDEETRVHTVKLQVNYKDLAEELEKAVESNTAVEEVFSPLPTLYDCSIIHVNSPTSFYVQLTKDVSQLEHITDVLLDAETEFPVFTDLQVGAICAAQFPEDLAYYRAEIVALLEDNKCEVHYIDFGNNSITDKFYKLPEDLLKTERYSKQCSLDSTCPLTPEVMQHFSQFVDTRFSETFQLEFLKTSDTLNIVRVFYQEKNIIQEILQIIKNGGVDGALMNGNAAMDDDSEEIVEQTSSGIGSLNTNEAQTNQEQ